jgi:DNA-binding transcriptional ArsR family regulator/CheY-like chemotaxis protein
VTSAVFPSNFPEALVGAVAEHRPDLVVTDVRMPPGFGNEGLRAAVKLRTKYPGLPIVVLSHFVETRYVDKLLDSNEGRAVGYLLKERVAEVESFVASLRQVAEGGAVIDPSVIRRLLQRPPSPGHGPGVPARLDGANRHVRPPSAPSPTGRSGVTYNQMVVDNVPTEEQRVDLLFHALSDATRRDILHRSVEGGLSVSRLAEDYPMSFAAVQKHVAVLERAGLVSKERRGREQLVRTEPDAVLRARAALDRIEDVWRGRVDRMTLLLTEDPGVEAPGA